MAEINCVGLPAIYIPSPYVADNHQEYNARAVEERGAAAMIRESELSEERLYREIGEILDDSQRWEAMHRAALELAKPDAAARIAEIAEGLLHPGAYNPTRLHT